MSSWKLEAKAKGSLAATEELLRLNVNMEEPIDVFDIIETNGIWLVFDQLDAALGMFVRQEATAGILINNRRPRSVQRLTAAHEYGHFRLGHRSSLDRSREIDGFSQVRQEVEAQAFALDFLMPLPLVERSWDTLRLPQDANSVHAHQAYQLATSMGVSYIACVVQLRAMEQISYGKSKELLDYSPKTIKSLLTDGVGPIDPWADIWPVEYEDNGRRLHVRQRDEIRIKLPEHPSNGYRWQLEGSPDVTPFSIVGDDFEVMREEELCVGAGGHRFLSLRAELVGNWALGFRLARAWAARSSVDKFELAVEVLQNEYGGEQTGLREGIKRGLLAGAQ